MKKVNGKSVKRLLPVALAATLTAGVFASCGGKVADDEKTVEVYAFSGGYGVEWLETLAENYEAAHEGVTIEVKSDGMLGKADAMVRTGSLETTDLYVTTDHIMKWLHEGNGVVKGYDFVLEPLDEVYEYKPDGGDKTVEELIHPSYAKNSKYTYYNADDEEESHYFALPWSGNVTGIVYNKTLFDQYGISAPRTTEELWEVCEKIKGKGKVPFVSSTETGYTDYLLQTWIAQYMTIENYEKFFLGRDENNNFGPSIWNSDAFLPALTAYEKMLSPDVGYSHKNINTLSFTHAQAQMLLGNCLMMVNGDWVEKEMQGKSEEDYTLDIMSAPVLSDITNKTSFASNARKEAILRELISYIDGDSDTRPAEANASDEEIVRNARRATYGLLNHNMYIPSYATAKEEAKEFLKYLCTKEAFDVYYEKTDGGILPLAYEVEESTLSAMQKNKMKLYSSAEYLPMQVYYPMVHTGGLSMFGNVSPETKFTSKNADDRMTAREIVENIRRRATQATFDQIAEKAGLI